MTDADFQSLGQPGDNQLKRLPIWAAEWIQSLKYDVLDAWHKQRGLTFYARVRLTPAEYSARQDRINELPEWAIDWIYTLKFEIWWQAQAIPKPPSKKRTTLFELT